MELSFRNEKGEWKWHDKYHHIQIRYYPEERKSSLRKVNLDEKYIVYARKENDYTLSTLVAFLVQCEKNKTITTSKKYSNGEPIKLTCSEKGDALFYEGSWSGNPNDVELNENIDGFSIHEYFTYWDFRKLDQEITLKKAK